MEDLTPDHSLRSLARTEWLSFSGDPTENVLIFVQAVHRFAFAHSRQKDGVWMADYAYGCLSEEALDWFEDLDLDIKQDWSSLRPAMIANFRRNKGVPTAPMAGSSWMSATPPATAIPRPAAISSRCRVKVVRGSGAVAGYITRPTQGDLMRIVASAEGAHVLEIPKVWDTNPTLVRIRTAAHIDDHTFLGLEKGWGNPPSWNLREWPEGSVLDGGAQVDTTNVTLAGVWTVKTLDDSTEELCPEWIDNKGARVSLQVSFCSFDPTHVWIAKKPPNSGYELVKLILDRF
ncbi:hypothetical protein FRB94_003552 [Tulasnella sp. JGI-2019a]|nr:hypothetical protein FRB94_003552 [Tulasnella sp. JGI-2019a]